MMKREGSSVTMNARIFMAAALEAITRYVIYAAVFNPLIDEEPKQTISLRVLVNTLNSSIALQKTL